MFLRKKDTPADESKPEEKKEEKPVAQVASVLPKPETASKPITAPVTTDSLKELLEKNLKWSQIIYEQNRRIHSKLVWSAVADWLRVFLILIPLALALIYLPPIIGKIWAQYEDLFGTAQTGKKPDQNTLNNLFKTLNIDPARQEQIKALLK